MFLLEDGQNVKEEGCYMSNPKHSQQGFSTDELGNKSQRYGGNKGKKYQDTSGKHAQVIQTKGE
jgi:small acid-soluble spore protein N (minor)